MKRRIRKRSTAGFTLIEVLVVIIIISVLFAIIAPGWETFLSRQRVNTAREQVLQVMRQAQTDARITRTPRTILLDANTSGRPRVAVIQGSSIPTGAALSSVSNWQSLPQGVSEYRTVNLRSTAPGLTFDANGAIAQPPIAPAAQLPADGSGFKITLSRAGSTAVGSNRCIIIQTLLGATRAAEGNDCQVAPTP